MGTLYKLLDVCDFQGGTQPPKDEWVSEPQDGYVRMLQIRDYSQDSDKYAEYVRDSKKLHKCTEDDIMLSRYGYIGQAFTGLAGAYNVALVKVIKLADIENKYLLYYFKSQKFQRYLLDNVGSRATIPGFNKSELKDAKICIPSCDQQKSICRELSTVESIMATRQAQLQKLDKLVKARFVEMFGDVADNPRGYEKAHLKDVAKGRLSYGANCSAIEYDGNTRYLRITDITDGGSLTGDAKSPSEINEKYLLFDGDILFARSGATVGKTYRYNKEDGRAIYAGYLIRLTPDTNRVLPDYIFWYTKTDYYTSFVANTQRAVAQPNINAQEYGSLDILVPPMEEQREFASFVAQVDKSGAAVRKALEEAQLLFDSLMQKYFG